MNDRQICATERLAIDGGDRVRENPLPPWPQFEADEIAVATEVLRSGKVNYWTGEEGRKFEREFAEFVGVKYAVAVTNGTVALELALHALGVGPGDEVVVPSKTFVATASCVVLCGATPVVADVDPNSQNITAASVARVLSPRTRAIIPVHFSGWPCEMDDLLSLAKSRGIHIIEDCAQSHGATYRGRMTGSLGDIGAFSFCQDKIMTTGGEGGMLVTNSRQLWERAWSYKDHGKSYEAVYERSHPPGFRWLHESFGTNWRITEMQSAIGRIQLKKLPGWLESRRRNAKALQSGLSGIKGLRVVSVPEHMEHAFYKYYAFIEPASLSLGWDQGRITDAIRAEGIPCIAGGCSEIYREKAFIDAGLGPHTRLPVASGLADTSMMFMLHHTMSERDMADTCAAVGKVMRIAA